MVLCNKQLIANHALHFICFAIGSLFGGLRNCILQDVGVAKGESVIKSLLEKEVDKVKTLSLFHLWLFIALLLEYKMHSCAGASVPGQPTGRVGGSQQ